MEHLSLQDPPPGSNNVIAGASAAAGPAGSGAGTPQPSLGSMAQQQVPQLPPQMFTTAAQLLDLTDTNLVLQDTIERIFVQNLYADIPRGVFLVRGENVLLLGEIDLDKDDYIPAPFERAPIEQVFALRKKEQLDRKRTDKARHAELLKLGFEGEGAGEIIM
ncbi:MAG: hypothetical protein M1819_001068 [Sarea resinae]|nr:MAG: hypothetical protein M1819_001068 [Sarea resinae]